MRTELINIYRLFGSVALLAVLLLQTYPGLAQEWHDALPRASWSQLERVPSEQNWFEIYKLADSTNTANATTNTTANITYAIYEPNQWQEVISYLLVGKEKALLVDTGMGIGDIKAVVEQLTDLPLIVINTHTHYDHVGSNYQFKTLYGRDTPFTRNNSRGKSHKAFSSQNSKELVDLVNAQTIWKNLPEDFSLDTYESKAFTITHHVSDAEIIDLGSRKIEIIFIPGHTPDSIALLDRDNRLLLTGDSFYLAPLYLRSSEASFSEFLRSTEILLRLETEVDYLLPGHNETWQDSSYLSKLHSAALDVLDPESEYVRSNDTRQYEFSGFSMIVPDPPLNSAEQKLFAERSLAEEAYIYAFPMLRNYATLYKRTVLAKRPLNRFVHQSKLLGPDFTTIVGPNNDTLYSATWLDLRREPLIVSVPMVANGRYFSLQFIDLLVNNFAYIGLRATGSEAGNYAIVGPNQSYEVIPGVSKIFRSESDFVFVIGRMLADKALDHSDEQVAAAILAQYKVTPLSEFLGADTPAAVAKIRLPEFSESLASSIEFIGLTNYLLQYLEIHASEKNMLDRFKKIGIAPGLPFNVNQYSSETSRAISEGIEIAKRKIAAEGVLIGRQIMGWNTTFEGFGSRSVMQGKPLLKAAAAKLALYGNDREENSSLSRQLDANREQLTGSRAYTLRFEKGAYPPAGAFWSLTMYKLPAVQLVENEIARYSIGDRTAGLEYGSDGSLTLYLQHARPAVDKLANWLPAPAGKFVVALRMYLPDPDVYSGAWQPPELFPYKDD